MANDLAKIQETQYQRFPMLIADGVARTEWRRVAGEPLTGKGPLLQRSSLSGTSHFTAQTEGSDPTAEALDTVKNTITSVTYEKLHVLTRAQRRHNPELPNEITNMMVDGALSTIANLYWTAFDTVATTLHPGNQAPYLGGGGGAAYFCLLAGDGHRHHAGLPQPGDDSGEHQHGAEQPPARGRLRAAADGL
jgi:hypothetical protein